MNDTVEVAMDCRRVRRHLVAYLDDELAPGELVRMDEHLGHCTVCQDHLLALEDSTPVSPALDLDDGKLHDIQLRILDALDAEPLPSAGRPRHAPHSLREIFTGDVRLPRGLVVLYAAALLGVIGWAASGSLVSPPVSELVMDETDAPERTALEMHQPAAYTPSDGWF